MAEVILARIFPYGAPELQAFSRSAMSRGMVAATVIHFSLTFAIIALLKGNLQNGAGPAKGPGFGGKPPIAFEFIPSQDEPTPQKPRSPKPHKKSDWGTPEIVPDDKFVLQDSLEKSGSDSTSGSQTGDEGNGGEGEGGIAGGDSNEVVDDDNRRPNDWEPHEAEPQLIHVVTPRYPEIAMKARMEGMVHLRVWVDKQGRVREVIVLRSDAEIFEQPAIAAAQQMLFTPAMQDKQPVAVWVSLPIKFILKARSS